MSIDVAKILQGVDISYVGINGYVIFALACALLKVRHQRHLLKERDERNKSKDEQIRAAEAKVEAMELRLKLLQEQLQFAKQKAHSHQKRAA